MVVMTEEAGQEIIRLVFCLFLFAKIGKIFYTETIDENGKTAERQTNLDNRKKVARMLKDWTKPAAPKTEELQSRLAAAQKKFAAQQMLIKEKKLPVLVLVEGGDGRQGVFDRADDKGFGPEDF